MSRLPPILIVDLDESFIKTDVLMEATIRYLGRRPWAVFKLFVEALRGALSYKNFLARSIAWDIDKVPVNLAVLKFLEERKNQQKIILVSASPDLWVQAVAKNYIGLWSSVHGSQNINLKGKAKLQFIQNTFPHQPFSYLGDSRADLEIWTDCHEIIAVDPSKGLQENIKRLNKPQIILQTRENQFLSLVKAMRPHQWSKNLLVFLPIIAGHIFETQKLIQGLLALCGFSIAASTVYLVNDLVDLDSDRNHTSKKNRPLASGALSLNYGFWAIPGLLGLSIVIGAAVSKAFLGMLLGYFFINILYSFKFKKVLGLDIILLSMMYSLRIIAGGVAENIPITDWMLAFSTLFFFSLAGVKRCSELLKSTADKINSRRGYVPSDYSILTNIGVGSGLLSILVFVLYLQSPEVRQLYHSPQLLWLVIPLLLYFQTRIWILTSRGSIDDDPVLFVIKDKITWFLVIAMGILLFGASFPWTI